MQNKMSSLNALGKIIGLFKSVTEQDCCEPAIRTTLVPPTVDIEDCDGVVSQTDALPTTVRGVVSVKMCGSDYEKAIRCDINTGNQVLIITAIDESGVPTTTYFDMVSGAAYTGNPATDLATCSDIDTESDAQEMCDNGTNFLRWFVKQDGEPTGVTFDTDTTGALYTASGTETIGVCGCTPIGSVGTINDWSVIN